MVITSAKPKKSTVKAKGARRAAGKLCSIAVIAAILVTMMPLMRPALAYNSPTAADYKARMDEAQKNIELYSRQLKADEEALADAKEEREAAEAAREAAARQLSSAEEALNAKSRKYVDSKITEAWNGGDKTAFARDSFSQYIIDNSNGAITYDNAYVTYLSSNRLTEAKSKAKYSSIITAFENKYGAGTFEEAYNCSLGYLNMMRALELIDRCNSIRASKTELAKFYVDVLGTEVPDNVPQLRISPYMMTGSAMSATLNSCQSATAHIYSAGGLGCSGSGQIIQSGQKSDDNDTIRLGDPFAALWTNENSRKLTSGHNKTLSDADYNVTGAAIINPNPHKAKAVFCQDFRQQTGKGWRTYSVEEYRQGLRQYCSTEYAKYNTSAAAYDSAVSRYNAANTAYNNAEAARRKSDQNLFLAQSSYNNARVLYENALESESSSGRNTSHGSSQDSSTTSDASASAQPDIQTDNSHAASSNTAGKTTAGTASASGKSASASGGILPAPVIRKIVVKRTTAKVTLAGTAKGCRYQYQVRKAGSSGWKSKTSSKAALTLRKLKKKGCYEIRVRAYRKLNGTKHYSKWTTVKVKNTKKGSKTFRFN